jgi:hypothetical protein
MSIKFRETKLFSFQSKYYNNKTTKSYIITIIITIIISLISNYLKTKNII